MNKTHFSTLSSLLVFICALLLTLTSCEEDYLSLGSNVIRATHLEIESETHPVLTHNKALPPIQTNALPDYFLGAYNDPLYGKTKAGILSQLTFSSLPKGLFPEIDSVAVYLPFHVSSETDDNGEVVYSLDSVYGSLTVGKSNKMLLSIYRSNFFLKDYNPDTGFEQQQKYYSDGSASDGVPISPSEIMSESISSTPIVLDNKKIVLVSIDKDGEEETTVLTPGIRLIHRQTDATVILPELDFWQQSILDKTDTEDLEVSSNFKNYFRGLYFSLGEMEGEGTMAMIDTSKASITISYHSVNDTDQDGDGIPDDCDTDSDNDGIVDEGSEEDDSDGDGIADACGVSNPAEEDLNNDGFNDEEAPFTSKTALLKFSGNTINLLEKEFTLNDGNPQAGDEKLYLKGGEGGMAVLHLFAPEDLDGNQISDELDSLKEAYVDENGNKKRLINEANLVFYEDESLAEVESHASDRVFIYDLKNNIPLTDYYTDVSSTSDPLNSLTNHMQRRTTDDQGRKRFKIKVTEHLKNLIYKDSTNTKLGICITTNVNSAISSHVLNQSENEEVAYLSYGTVLSQRGTILYGSNTGDEEKNVKLEIFYTEADQLNE